MIDSMHADVTELESDYEYVNDSVGRMNESLTECATE